jgi:hypothetical protein
MVAQKRLTQISKFVMTLRETGNLLRFLNEKIATEKFCTDKGQKLLLNNEKPTFHAKVPDLD